MDFSSEVLSFLASTAVRSAGLAAIALAGVWLARAKSAASRHAVCAAVTAAMLLLAALTAVGRTQLTLPAVPVRVLWEAPVPAAVPLVTFPTIPAARVTVTDAVTWQQVAAAIYFAGVLLFLVRIAYGYLFTRRLVRASRPAPQFAGQAVYESSWISVPMTTGWLRPEILLPAGWEGWEPAKLEAVLAHERAHVRRADWAMALMAAVNRCLFWFHPLAWWLERRLAVLAEQACDDAALLEVSSSSAYAQALLDMAATVKRGGGRMVWEAMAMAKATEVKMRIERILDETRQIPRGVTPRRWVALAACSLPVVYLAAVLHLAPVQAQERASPRTAAPTVSAALAAEQNVAAPRGRLSETADLPDGELKAAKDKLDQLETAVTKFKSENMGRLPEQFQANTAQLQSLQTQLSNANESLSHNQQQKRVLETALQNLQTQLNYYRSLTDYKRADLNAKIVLLQSRLQAAKDKMTPNHPDVRALETDLLQVQNLLAEFDKQGVRQDPQNQKMVMDLQMSMNVLMTEMQNNNLQMEEKRKQVEELNRMIGADDQRIEASPQLEQQYAALIRDYEHAQQSLADILNRVEAPRIGGRTTGPTLIFRREPEYTEQARKARIQGTVELSVTIGANGVARDMRVIRGLDAGLDRKAIECVTGWRFRPASRDGEPIAAFATVEVRFSLSMR